MRAAPMSMMDIETQLADCETEEAYRSRENSPEEQIVEWWESTGLFFKLPGELRNSIYNLLLVSQTPESATYGKGSGVKTAILSTCRTIYDEATQILYSTHHIIPGIFRPHDLWATIPQPVLPRLERVTLELNFHTREPPSRGRHIVDFEGLLEVSEAAGLAFRSGTALREFCILLRDQTLRRRKGSQRIMTVEMREQTRQFLRPFAFLPRLEKLEVHGYCGSGVLEYIEIFDELRQSCIGRGDLVEDLIENIMHDIPSKSPIWKTIFSRI